MKLSQNAKAIILDGYEGFYEGINTEGFFERIFKEGIGNKQNG